MGLTSDEGALPTMTDVHTGTVRTEHRLGSGVFVGRIRHVAMWSGNGP